MQFENRAEDIQSLICCELHGWSTSHMPPWPLDRWFKLKRLFRVREVYILNPEPAKSDIQIQQNSWNSTKNNQ